LYDCGENIVYVEPAITCQLYAELKEQLEACATKLATLVARDAEGDGGWPSSLQPTTYWLDVYTPAGDATAIVVTVGAEGVATCRLVTAPERVSGFYAAAPVESWTKYLAGTMSLARLVLASATNLSRLLAHCIGQDGLSPSTQCPQCFDADAVVPKELFVDEMPKTSWPKKGGAAWFQRELSFTYGIVSMHIGRMLAQWTAAGYDRKLAATGARLEEALRQEMGPHWTRIWIGEPYLELLADLGRVPDARMHEYMSCAETGLLETYFLPARLATLLQVGMVFHAVDSRVTYTFVGATVLSMGAMGRAMARARLPDHTLLSPELVNEDEWAKAESTMRSHKPT
jgi:hypothetical protein